MLTTRKDLMTFVELCSDETVDMLNKIVNKHTTESRIIIENEDKKEFCTCNPHIKLIAHNGYSTCDWCGKVIAK